MQKLNSKAASVNMQSAMQKANKVRHLQQDLHYVIKEIDTENFPDEVAMDALNEIQMLAELESHFIVGYYDSFIEGSKINIIMEYCPHGDLCNYLKKQNGKPLIDNFIWKAFIHICLGL